MTTILNFEGKGLPIAKIVGGKYDNKILYVFDKRKYDEMNKKCCNKCDDKCKHTQNKCCEHCKVLMGGCCGGNIDDDANYSSSDEDNENNENDENFEGINKNKDTFKMKNGKMIPIPNIEIRECIYVSGPSGSGKSTWAAEYASMYKKLFPDNDIIIFSRKEKDPVLDRLKPLRIKLDNEIINHPIDPTKELKDSLVIFDDIDTIHDDDLKDELQKLRKDILEIGRADSTYCVSTTHTLLNYQETKPMLIESHNVTFFPEMTPDNQIHNYLKIYVGLSSKQIRKIMFIQSRWVSIYNKNPRYVLYETGCFLLSSIRQL